MRISMMLTILALIMVIVLGWRLGTGGRPGPKTYALIAGTVVVAIGAVVSRRRETVVVAPSATTVR
jgi:hypothetical protein